MSKAETISRAAAFHGHLGPFLVIGVGIGLKGMKELGARAPCKHMSVVASLPLRVPFSCILDGIQVSTGCTVGNRRLALRNSKRIQVEFRTDEGGQKVVISPKNSFLENLKARLREGTSDTRIRQLALEIARIAEGELFDVKRRTFKKGMQPLDEQRRINDLGTAKQRLKEKDLSLVFVKNSRVIFETDSEGLGGFLRAVDALGESLSGSSVADKIVGRAAAFLCVHSKARAVFAVTMSQAGRETLEAHGVPFEYEVLVPTILNRKKTGRCPFEMLIENAAGPEEALKRIRRQCS